MIYSKLLWTIPVGVIVYGYVYMVLVGYIQIKTELTKKEKIGKLEPTVKIQETQVPFYIRQHRIKCDQVISGDKNAIQSGLKEKFSRNHQYGEWKRFRNCTEIRSRYYYPKEPLSSDEAEFPIAYAILVFQDLDQIELLFNALYQPQNLFCFHVDLKSPHAFHDVMKRLSECFPNVLISDDSYPLDSTGIFMMKAFYSCLKRLNGAKVNSNWKYVITIQNHDFPLRTNKEMVEILKIYNGSNDVELLPPIRKRYEWSHFWLTDSSGYPAGQQRSNKLISSPPPQNITLYKGSTGAALSRAFVRYILIKPIVKEFLKWLDPVSMGDEFFWSTLNHDEKFNAPGGYPGSCLIGHKQTSKKNWNTRYAVWQPGYGRKCNGYYRHTVCLFGMADLSTLAKRPELFGNKFWISDFPGTAYCMHELLFNRTYLAKKKSTVDFTILKDLSAVKYEHWKQRRKELQLPIDSKYFNCTHCSKCEESLP